jgi:hypothetical protein
MSCEAPNLQPIYLSFWISKAEVASPQFLSGKAKCPAKSTQLPLRYLAANTLAPCSLKDPSILSGFGPCCMEHTNEVLLLPYARWGAERCDRRKVWNRWEWKCDGCEVWIQPLMLQWKERLAERAFLIVLAPVRFELSRFPVNFLLCFAWGWSCAATTKQRHPILRYDFSCPQSAID